MIFLITVPNETPNQPLERMTSSATSLKFQIGCHWRASRHRSAFRSASGTHLFMRSRLLLLVTLFAATIVGCSTTRHAYTLSDNKAVVLRSEAELWSKGNLAVADE